MSPLWRHGARSLAEMIRRREVSSLEVTEALIARNEQVQPHINALVVPSFELALQQARSWDSAPRPGAPLGGVPFSVKEIFNVAGMPCTLGSQYRKDFLARHTATTVRRLLDAGGVLLGLTNLPERSFWSESYNQIYGRTNNPYDKQRIPGGSSGGEAALVGAGASPLGLGSDIGGSIRLPAFYCGVFGHKPSAGLVPTTGHYPFEQPVKLTAAVRGAPLYMCAGPLAHRAEDLELALELLAGPDGIDPLCSYKLAPAEPGFDWSGRIVYVIPRPRLQRCSAVQGDIARGVVQAARALEKLGARVEELPDDLFYKTIELWSIALGEENEGMSKMLGDGSANIPLVWETLKIWGGKSKHTPPALLFAWLDLAKGMSPRRLRQTLAEIGRLRLLLERRLQDKHLLLMPPQPTVAPFHDEMLGRPFDFGYTAVINILQLPATAIPLGLNAQGLPFGVQAIAAPGRDRLCLAAARALEQAFGGWQPPIYK